MSQHTNKWGWQGYNCKMRPAGSGTTHSTRREQRKALQWDQLAANHQPDTEDSLEKQLEALEKAAQKAKEKMEELKEKKRKEEEEEEEESYYSYYSSPTPPKKLPKKGKGKAKPQPKSLEKDRPRSVSVRRTRVAKYGQKEQLLELKEEEEEGGGKASSSKPPGQKPPGKWVLAEALEKASVPEEGNKEHGKKDQALEKAPVVRGFGKGHCTGARGGHHFDLSCPSCQQCGARWHHLDPSSQHQQSGFGKGHTEASTWQKACGGGGLAQLFGKGGHCARERPGGPRAVNAGG